jgi:hypothetical protein
MHGRHAFLMRAASLAPLALLMVGCTSILGRDQHRYVGQVIRIEIPDTVGAGQAFDVVVHTGGPDGCWTKDGTDVKGSGMEATITPYDVHDTSPDITCPQSPVEFLHTASLTFNEPGNARVLVTSRDSSRGYDVVVR